MFLQSEKGIDEAIVTHLPKKLTSFELEDNKFFDQAGLIVQQELLLLIESAAKEDCSIQLLLHQ
jgi:hypothetical protein